MPELNLYSDSWGSFSALVREAVSGGQFLKSMSSIAPTGAQVASDTLEVMIANASGDEDLCCGLALDNAASGERVTVITRGLIKTYAVGAVVAGKAVQAAGDANVPEGVKTLEAGSYIVPGPRGVGMSLDDAASGELVFVNINIGGGV